MNDALLEVTEVSVLLPAGDYEREVLRDVSLSLAPGEALGLVGESGSGKTMTARAITRLLPPKAKVNGSITLGDWSVLSLGDDDLRKMRRTDVGTIFQDPRAAINPIHTIGDFLVEALVTVDGASANEASRLAISTLNSVGIRDGAARMRQYPHELSGGLLQRVMIAAVLMSQPRLLIADEPTTALDVTTQEEVMAILDDQRRERGLAMLFITHDLELASAVCDRICVMYAGSIVEVQSASSLEDCPVHPYTRALFAARPRIDETLPELAAIPGQPISAYDAPAGCAFASRCRYAKSECHEAFPALERRTTDQTALTRCLRADELQANEFDAGRTRA